MQFSQKHWSFGLKSLSRRSQQSQRSNRNHQVPGSLNCIYFLAIARIVVIKWKPACFSRCTKIPKQFQCCLIDPAGNNTKSETDIKIMHVNLFFLKYYITYTSVLLSKFRNHPVVFLVIAVCFTTIISVVIRSITA